MLPWVHGHHCITSPVAISSLSSLCFNIFAHSRLHCTTICSKSLIIVPFPVFAHFIWKVNNLSVTISWCILLVNSIFKWQISQSQDGGHWFYLWVVLSFWLKECISTKIFCQKWYIMIDNSSNLCTSLNENEWTNCASSAYGHNFF